VFNGIQRKDLTRPIVAYSIDLVISNFKLDLAVGLALICFSIKNFDTKKTKITATNTGILLIPKLVAKPNVAK
jgi:hypothetical protein